MTQTHTITRSCDIAGTFRSEQVAGMFDLPLKDKLERTWTVQLPTLDESWQIGAIVGPSGAGKSVLAAEAYPETLCRGYEWPDPASGSMVDGFDEQLDGKSITNMLNSVGFSSPPDWVKPFAVLSNGQQFRAQLARALLSDAELVVMDEFTSVVDRQVAQFGSAAIAKTIRAGRACVRRFVAVSCHYDFLPWLEPDWVLDMGDPTNTESGRLSRGWVQSDKRHHAKLCGGREPIRIDICLAHKSAWATFAHHHYLSSKLNDKARCYLAWWGDRPVAFCATLPNAGHVGKRIVTRLVVLPDYQGMGIGIRLLESVTQREAAQGRIVSIRTSHPALIRALDQRRGWQTLNVQRSAPAHVGFSKKEGRAVGSMGRFTASFRWVGLPRSPASPGPSPAH